MKNFLFKRESNDFTDILSDKNIKKEIKGEITFLNHLILGIAQNKNTDNDTFTLYDEPVNSFPEFKSVYLDNKEENNGLEERIHEALNKINEELCPAGKAYIKRRKAAGEKSSAYLSGRAVKVCKGQMSGKSKKK